MPRPASGWKSSEFVHSAGLSGFGAYFAQELMDRGHVGFAVATFACSAALAGLYAVKRLHLKGRALMAADSTTNAIASIAGNLITSEVIDQVAESAIKKIETVATPKVAAILVAKGLDPGTAQAKAENLVSLTGSLAIELIDTLTDLKAAAKKGATVPSVAAAK